MDEKPTETSAVSDAISGIDTFWIEEAPPWLPNTFYAPGDWLLAAIQTHLAPVAQMLHLAGIPAGGWVSAVLSAVVWVLAFQLLFTIWRTGRELDRSLTRVLIDGWASLQHHCRTGIDRVVYHSRRLFRGRFRRRNSAEATPLPAISERDLNILRLHAELPPANALTLSEIATTLGLGRDQTRSIVARLSRLGLLGSTLTGCDGEDAYRLTRTGHACVQTQHS